MSSDPAAPPCDCLRCSRERTADMDFQLRMLEPIRFACEICGCKRCPHHSDHRLTCTGSNKPGQPGSVYQEPGITDGWSQTPSRPTEAAVAAESVPCLHPDGTAAQLPQGSLLVLAQCYDRGDANITLTDAKGLPVGALRVVVPAA